MTFILEEGSDGGTDLEMIHEDVPDDKEEDISNGWKDHYWDKMKEYFAK